MAAYQIITTRTPVPSVKDYVNQAVAVEAAARAEEDVEIDARLDALESDASFGTFIISGQSDVVASESGDSLTLIGGTNVTITTNSSTKEITINAIGGVTLDGSLDYITITGQTITRGAIDLTTDITGNLPIARLNSGSGASASTFWRGDGTWSDSFTTLSASGVVTLSGNGTASTAILSITGTPFSGTGTTSFPLVYINSSSATASSVLNTSGTAFGINATGTVDLINALLNGVSRFKIQSSGTIIAINDCLISGDIVSRNGAAAQTRLSAAGVVLGNGADLNLSRLSSGVLAVGTGAAGSVAGSISLTNGTFNGSITQNAGKVFNIASGTNQRAGNATLVSGTVTVSNTTVTANTIIMLTRKTLGGTAGIITYTVNASVGFTINSDNVLDTSTISYLLIEVT